MRTIMNRIAPLALTAVLVGLFGCTGPSDYVEETPEKSLKRPARWWNLDPSTFSDFAKSQEIRDIHFEWKREMDFLLYLQQKPAASTADAVKAVALSIDIVPWEKSLDDLVGILIDRSIIRPEWKISESKPLTKGKFAYMICRACGIRGGLFMTLFGPSERYCLKELVYHEIMAPGCLSCCLPGQEVLNIIAQADFLTGGGFKKKAGQHL